MADRRRLSIYRKIDVRMWGDAKFRSLSQDAKFLWLFLLTGPLTTSLPGLLNIGKIGLCEHMDWPTEKLDMAIEQLEMKGMVEADWSAKIVWICNSIKYNPPDNPNVVKSWAYNFSTLPECEIRDKALIRMYEQMQDRPELTRNEFESMFKDHLERVQPGIIPTLGPTVGPTVGTRVAERVGPRVVERVDTQNQRVGPTVGTRVAERVGPTVESIPGSEDFELPSNDGNGSGVDTLGYNQSGESATVGPTIPARVGTTRIRNGSGTQNGVCGAAPPSSSPDNVRPCRDTTHTNDFELSSSRIPSQTTQRAKGVGQNKTLTDMAWTVYREVRGRYYQNGYVMGLGDKKAMGMVIGRMRIDLHEGIEAGVVKQDRVDEAARQWLETFWERFFANDGVKNSLRDIGHPVRCAERDLNAFAKQFRVEIKDEKAN